MAVIEYASTPVANGLVVHTWADLQSGDTGRPLILSGAQGIAASIQFVGGAGALEASNDGTNWVIVKDLQGSDISGATGLLEFSSSAARIRPTASANGVTATIVTRDG